MGIIFQIRSKNYASWVRNTPLVPMARNSLLLTPTLSRRLSLPPGSIATGKGIMTFLSLTAPLLMGPLLLQLFAACPWVLKQCDGSFPLDVLQWVINSTIDASKITVNVLSVDITMRRSHMFFFFSPSLFQECFGIMMSCFRSQLMRWKCTRSGRR